MGNRISQPVFFVPLFVLFDFFACEDGGCLLICFLFFRDICEVMGSKTYDAGLLRQVLLTGFVALVAAGHDFYLFRFGRDEIWWGVLDLPRRCDAEG